MTEKNYPYELSKNLQTDYQRYVKHRELIQSDEDYRLLISPVHTSDIDGERVQYPLGEWMDAFEEGQLKVTDHDHLVALTATTENYVALVFNDETEELRFIEGEQLEGGNEQWGDKLKSLSTPEQLCDEYSVAFRLMTDLDLLDDEEEEVDLVTLSTAELLEVAFGWSN
jgi:hypothetical protein